LYSKANAAWSSGLKPSDSLGPFLDRLGRPAWIDVFPVIRNLRFQRKAGARPFLVLPIEVVIGSQSLFGPHKPAPTEFKLAAGSVWIQSQQLAVAAPADGFTGLKIRGGTLNLSAPPTVGTSDNLVAAPTITVTVDLTLDPSVSPSGTGPGADARAAVAETQRQFVSYSQPPVRVWMGRSGTDVAYGCDVGLKLTGKAPAFVPAFNQIAFPATPSMASFSISAVTSSAFVPTGSAPIASAAWIVPVATVDPAHLGTATGTGALALGLAPGLKASWLGQPRLAMLENCVIGVDAQTLALATATAQGDRLRLLPELGASDSDQLDLSWQSQFPIIFVSQAEGTETIWTDARLDASFTKPVDVNGWRLPLHSDAATLILLVTKQEIVLIIEAALTGGGQKQVALSLVNSLLGVTWPTTLCFAAQFDGTKCIAGGVLLAYRLLRLLPTLPDPYAASSSSLKNRLLRRDAE
jgi:hypothetical protein